MYLGVKMRKRKTCSRSILIISFSLVSILGCDRCSDAVSKTGEKAGFLKSRIPCKIDVHTHISRDYFDRAVKLMDRAGINVNVNMSAGFSGDGFEKALAESSMTNGRILNDTRLDWSNISDPSKFAEDNIKNLNEARSMGARGVKISKELGLGIVLSDGSLLRVDDPRMNPVWREAGKLGMPVSIHVADPVAFFKPPTEDNERYQELRLHPHWSFYGSQWPSFDDLIGQFKKVVESNPGTVFIGVHFGNYAENPDFVGEMLDRYPNYYIDTAARIPEFGRHPAEKMRNFFIKHQERILFGTDIGVGGTLFLGSSDGTVPGDEDTLKFYQAHWRYFETPDRQMDTPTPIQGDWKIDGIDLPGDVLEKLYCGNARRLFGIKS